MNGTRIEGRPTTFFRGLSECGLLGRAGLALSLLLAIAVTTATPAMAQTSALNFTDPLTGPSSSYLTVDTTKYGYGANGLIRTQSTDGNTYGNGDPNSDRPMVKTVSGAFLTEDFEFDVDVTAPTSNTDLIYVGLGQGIPNPNYFNEPTESFKFRIHNNIAGYYGIQAAVDVGQISMGFAFDQPIGVLQPGVTTTFRIVRSGNNVTLSVPSQPGASVTVPLTLVPSLNSANAYLFFGNTAVGTTFSNFRVFPLADTTPPVISKLTATPSVIWPPNHRMVQVALDAVATDNVGVTSLKILSVAVGESSKRGRGHEDDSNEPEDHEHHGDSAKPDDYTITGDLTLKVRAERGNVYTITVQALDAAGNSATKTVTVSVPKDQGRRPEDVRYPF